MANILERRGHLSLSSDLSHNLSSFQARLDQTLSSALAQSSDWKSLAAMTAGSLAYRLGNIAFLNVGAPCNVRLLLAPLFGLASEVTAFRSAQSLLSPSHSSSILASQEWMSDFINFGTLKIFGRFSQNQNPLFSHLFQDTGMVAGHQLAYSLGLSTKPQGNLIDQYLHAEITNLQMGFGMALVHQLSQGKLQAFEKHLELTQEAWGKVKPDFPAKPLVQNLASSSAMAGEGPFSSRPSLPSSLMAAMVNIEGTRSGSAASPRPSSLITDYREAISSRLAALPNAEVSETQSRLQREWEEWKKSSKPEAATATLLEQMLPHYARYCLAHLGKQTPPQLPFIQEVYEMSAAQARSEHEIEITEAHRTLLIRFLSTQSGRRSAGEKFEESAPPPAASQVKVEDTQAALGKTYAVYETFLREGAERVSTSPLERARIYQRGLALLHFYTAELIRQDLPQRPAAFEKLPFKKEVLEQVLRHASAQAYPEKSLALFADFFREVLREEIEMPSLSPRSEEALPREALETPALRFVNPPPGETWAEYLSSLGFTRGKLQAAELGIAGSTIFAWGSSEDCAKRVAPPGDILDLLGLVTYINSSRERGGIDPFDALRLTLPEQLKNFTPNARSEVVIWYPKSMEGLDYAHFGLGAFLRAHLRSIPDARDMDLAAQWGVSEGTVAEYRRGVVRKMRLETLEKLAANLTNSEAQRIEMFKFLMFLRYRPYFDASFMIHDQDGVALNHQAPYRSRVKIILTAHEEELRLPDITQRIRFEREPFASAINGSVDWALEFLERKTREFELTGQEEISASETLSRANLVQKIKTLRDQHITYFQLLSQHERFPGVIRPGELKEMQEFYRNFFRFFEAIYLHARASGVVQVGETSIPYEIVPSTHEHVQGLRFITDAHATTLKAYVVAADLLEKGGGLESAFLSQALHYRIARRHLEQTGVLLPGAEHAESNQGILNAYLAQQGLEGEAAEAFLAEYERLEEACSDWKGSIIDPSENAILHRITQGKLSQPGSERRKIAWQGDLETFTARHALGEISVHLNWVFERYLERVSQPYRQFDEASLDDLIRQSTEGEVDPAALASRLKPSLLQFMKLLGLATENTGASAIPISAEGFANAAFATYIQRFQEIHSLRSKGALIADETLIDRVLEDRLVDFAHLASQKTVLAARLKTLILNYNARQPLLKVYEIARTGDLPEPFGSQLSKLYESTLERFRRAHPESAPSSRLMFMALSELRIRLSESEIPALPEISGALAHALENLSRVGIVFETVGEKDALFLRELCETLSTRLGSLQRLGALIPAFVARERFQSGLAPSPALGEEVLRIYRRHSRSALLDSEALSLHQAIAQEVSPRFGAYSEIEADVIRGIQALYHEMLKSMQQRYAQLEESLELSLMDARDHKNKNRFIASLRDFSAKLDSPPDQLVAFKQQAEDLEALLELSSMLPAQRLSERLAEAEKEVEGLEAEAKQKLPPVDATELLQENIPKGIGNPYSEILLVSDAEVRAELDGKEERRSLAISGARCLIHLIILLRRYRPQLSAASAEKADEILLDIETISTSDLKESTRRIFEEYASIQAELVSKIPGADYVGTLPEIRNGEKPITGKAICFAIHNQLTRRTLPNDLKEAFDKQVEAALQRPLKFDEAYDAWLTSFYLRHREKIITAAEIKILGRDVQGTLPGVIIQNAKLRLEKEFPELSLVDVEQHQREFEQLNPAIADIFGHNEKSYDLLYIHAVMFQYFATIPAQGPLQKAAIEMLAEYSRLYALAASGGSLPHLLNKTHENIFKIYRKNHSAILAHIAREVGVDSLMLHLPEMKDPPFDARKLWEGIPGIRPLLIEPQNLFARATQMLQSLGSKTKRELEAALWDFSPPAEGARDEEMQASLKPVQAKIYSLYLAHRGDGKLRLDFLAHETPVKDNWSSYWEMGALQDQTLDERRALLQKYFDLEIPDYAVQIARVPIANEESREVIVHATITDQALARFNPTGPIERINLTAFQRMRMWLAVALPNEYRKIENFASIAAKREKPETNTLIEQDYHRAAALLASGIEPKWVLRTLKDRMLSHYRQYRDDIHSTISFAGYVGQLEDLRRIPEYEVEDRIYRAPRNPIFVRLLTHHNPLFVRIFALIFQGEVPAHITSRFSVEIGSLVETHTVAQVTEAAARYYLEHRPAIQKFLRPWPSATLSDIERLKKDPLLLKPEQAEKQGQKILRLNFLGERTPENEFLFNICDCIGHPNIPRKLQIDFLELLKAVRPRSIEAWTHAAVTFFILHETEIRRKLIP